MPSPNPQPSNAVEWGMELWRRALLAAEQVKEQTARVIVPPTGPVPTRPSDAPPDIW